MRRTRKAIGSFLTRRKTTVVFLLPSKWEGLGLVLVEAQAAGIPCVISDAVPHEADVVPELITRLSLEQALEDWSKNVLLATQKQQICSEIALNRVLESDFNVKQSIASLESLYNPSKTSAVK